MFREMRKKNRQLSTEEAIAILEKCPWGTLSTVGEDGWPYGLPVNYIVEDGIIYIHCAKTGHKLDNIRHNDKVCFTAVARANVLAAEFSTDYESAVAFGRASFVDDSEARLALQLIIEKYSPEFKTAGDAMVQQMADVTQVIRIDVEHITGKARK